jgi:hypothetical protein
VLLLAQPTRLLSTAVRPPEVDSKMGSISYEDGSMPAMEDQSSPLAIIGMATRFPQEATSNEELWKFLLKGRSAHSPFPEDRIHPGGHYHPDPEHGGTVGLRRRVPTEQDDTDCPFSLRSREAIFCPRTPLILTPPFSTSREVKSWLSIRNKESSWEMSTMPWKMV